MRERTTTELEFVPGGMIVCTPEEMGKTFYGISLTEDIGRSLINIYEGLIEATSYMIEWVATSFN